MYRYTGGIDINYKDILKAIFICIMIVTLPLSGCTQQADSTGDTATATPLMPSMKVIKVTDTTGKDFTMGRPAERIIVTNSDAAEVLIAIGAGDKIVGIADTIRKNPQLAPKLAHAEDIGNWQTPSVEKIVELRPDVLVSYASSKPKNVDQLEASGVKILYLDCYKMDKVASDARTLGILTGNEDRANEYADFIEGHIKMVQDRTSKMAEDQKPDVYVELYSTYTTPVKGSGGDQLIEMAGGKNLASDEATNKTSIKVSSEWVVSKNPDIMIKMVTSYNSTIDNMTAIRGELMTREGMTLVDAVKNEKVYTLSGNVAFGPRAVVGLAYAAKIIHPELFADMDPDMVLKEYSVKYFDGADAGYFVCPDV